MTNPSFNFTWDKSNKDVQAKVFAKKKQTAVRDNQVKMPNSQQNKTTNNDNSSKVVNYKRSDNPTQFVKRKRKKEKQKEQEQEEKEEDFEELLNSYSENNNKSVKPAKQNFSLFGQKHKKIYVSTESGESVSEKVFTSKGQKFSDITQIHKHILSNLEKHNFTKLTTVQEKAIPVILSGKNTLVRSQTGSGKTLAYAVPIVDALQSINPRIKRQDSVQAIIVVPTRELALQTHEIFTKINTFQWIVVGHLCGGENRKTEKDRLRKGVHILIGTPGRLLDHILHTAAFKINHVRCLVLDEADRLLDMGFRKDIVKIVEEIDKAKVNAEYDPMALLKSRKGDESSEENTDEKIRNEEGKNMENVQALRDVNSKARQTILLSATLSKDVTELAEFTMKQHVYIDALDATQNSSSTSLIIPDTVKQQFILTYVKHRLFTLAALLLTMSKKNSKVFVFMASSQMVEYHHELFTKCLLKMPKNRGKLKSGDVVLLDEDPDVEEDSEDEEEVVIDMPIFKLHGSMEQKMRKEVFTAFRSASKGVLLCTDVAARGLDVPTADCIVQYTGPQTDEDYLHRVGRTGRAGKSGSAIIFLTHEEQDYITRLQEHKVFLKERKTDDILNNLCELMEEPDSERAATALQRRFETAIAKDKDLHKSACFAYSSWSRFYNSYPSAMRSIFNFKNVNLGHYVTSFAIRDTPSAVAKVVRGEVKTIKKPRLNKKLAIHEDAGSKNNKGKKTEIVQKKRKSIALMTSEYDSGLQQPKKKKKKS